jgi:phosphate-selective porin OprO/OprP
MKNRHSARFLSTAALIMAGACLPGWAGAQGAFYREVAQDGRIYVFNNPKSFEQFEGSGEVGAGAITLLGKGPGGETMVFDCENALHMYNFKHDLPGEVFRTAEVPKPTPTMKVSWKDGKTTIETDKALMNISNRIQLRFTQELPDDATHLSGTPAKGDPKGSFRIRRAKLKFDGWIYTKKLQYEFQANWAELGGSAPGNALEDANINLDVKGDKTFMIKFGQFKVPFGRQELTSSGSQQFVDRSAVSNEFAKGRDMGLQLWGELSRSLVEWRVGMFNGNGRTKPSNDNDKYQFNARLTLQPMGAVKYEEADFEASEKPLFAVAGNFEMNDLTYPSSASESKLDVKDYMADTSGAATDLKAVSVTKATSTIKRTIFGADAVLKYKGLYATAEYFDRKIEPFDGEKFGSEFKSNGYFAQAGFRFNKKWEIAARYSAWDPTDKKDGDDRSEIGGAVSYYDNKHNLKLQVDFRQIEDKAKSAKDNELRVQTQFIF